MVVLRKKEIKFLVKMVLILPVKVYLFYQSVNFYINTSNIKLVPSITNENIIDKMTSFVPLKSFSVLVSNATVI